MCGFIFYHNNDLEKERFDASLNSIFHRGPDSTQSIYLDSATFGFQRLAIMDLTLSGNQPFQIGNRYVMCNGEIFNYEKLKEETDHVYSSKSDCAVLLPLFNKLPFLDVLHKLDGEYALVFYDADTNEIKAARDPMGIRPLFYGYSQDSGKIAFASEVKALKSFCKDIKPFPPGHYYEHGSIKPFKELWTVYSAYETDEKKVLKNIETLLEKAVIKRLHADAPMGFLLSGGLDSSLVCSIAQKHSKEPIRTFAIGMSEDAIDLKYAKEAANFIGSQHTEVIITKEDVLGCLKDVIHQLETWDITTIRASLGMYLVCKWIKENTDIKTLMTGEVSDELFGYKYTDFAPTPSEFQNEAAKRIKELYLYDVLRADRCIAGNSLEARVPFSDNEFVEYVMHIDPKLKMNTSGHGKYLLRKAFEEGDYLPDSLLWREKAAFSDAVGHSLVETVKNYAATMYKEKDLEKAREKYPHKPPFTFESLLYRDIFNRYYDNLSELIPDYWMPNANWENCKVSDPSARVLPNYGKSGD